MKDKRTLELNKGQEESSESRVRVHPHGLTGFSEVKKLRRVGPLLATAAIGIFSLSLVSPSARAGTPSYESAYFDGATVTINAIQVPQHVPLQAQADFYEVVYPIGWESLGIGTPQCAPCDHEGNGIDFTDYHDHILDSIPSSPGHGEYSPLWHVFVVLPAYTGDAAHDALVTAAYAAHIPAKSDEAVDALVSSTLPDGSPVAIEIDTHFYFICAVVSPHAAP
jgi:hypothetical protein